MLCKNTCRFHCCFTKNTCRFHFCFITRILYNDIDFTVVVQNTCRFHCCTRILIHFNVVVQNTCRFHCCCTRILVDFHSASECWSLSVDHSVPQQLQVTWGHPVHVFAIFMCCYKLMPLIYAWYHLIYGQNFTPS